MQSDVQTFVLRSFGWTWRLTVSCFHFSSWQTELLDTLRDGDWGIAPFFYLRVMCSGATDAAYAPWSQSLKSCRSCYYHSADWPIPLPIVIQQNGNLVSGGNVNRVQLGFVPCLFPANRLCRIPNPYLLKWTITLCQKSETGNLRIGRR